MATTMYAHMLGPHSRDAPRFKGKRILCFLVEYEFCTTAAHLTASQTICQITHYCDLKSERFIESLCEYNEEDWDASKSHLLEFYPSEEEKPNYKVDHLIKLVRKHRKLSSIEKFDNYICEFTIVTTALEEWKALSQTDKYDYFWRGIKPVSFHDKIANVLRNSKQWTGLTNPPPMDEAIQTIKLHLKRDLYRVPEDGELGVMSDAETSLSMMESDDESGSDNSDDESK
jgi:hypothetical protein